MKYPAFFLKLFICVLSFLFFSTVRAQMPAPARILITDLEISPTVINPNALPDTLFFNYGLKALATDTNQTLTFDSLRVDVLFQILKPNGVIAVAPTLIKSHSFNNLSLSPMQVFDTGYAAVPVPSALFAQGGNIVVVWPSGLNVSPVFPDDTIKKPLPFYTENEEPIVYQQITIAPNPFNKVAFVVSEQRLKSVNAIDVAGRKTVLSVSNQSFDVSELPVGVYILEIELENRQIFRTKCVRSL